MSLTLVELSDAGHSGLKTALEDLPTLPFRHGFGFDREVAGAAALSGLDGLLRQGGDKARVLLVEDGGDVVGGLGIARQEFESTVFGISVARTAFCFTAELDSADYADSVAEALVRGALGVCGEWRIAHWSILVPAADEPLKRAAIRAGWLLADSTLEIMWDLAKPETRTGVCDESVHLRRAEEADVPTLAKMAHRAYTSAIRTRYRADPRFPEEAIGELYAQWVKNACEGSFADVVVVSEVEGAIAGFDMLKLDPRLTSVTGVGLGARGFTVVNPAVRGRAISSCHTAWLNRWQHDKVGGMNTARVLINNTRIQRAVAKAGAVVTAAYHTFHSWPAPMR